MEQGLLEEDETIKKYVVDICDKNSTFLSFKYCNKCKNIKPPRTHHCSICGKCVMRMDHHCPWTGNCVGLKNNKYFICFLFWTIIACLYVWATSKFLNLEIPKGCSGTKILAGNCYGYF